MKSGVKVVVRWLPPLLPEATFWEAVEPCIPHSSWRRYAAGKASARSIVYSAAYVELPEDAVWAFKQAVDGRTFSDASGTTRCMVEYAPNPKVPEHGDPASDDLVGTIFDDPDYTAFLARLEREEAALSTPAVAAPPAGAVLVPGAAPLPPSEGEQATALVEYLRGKREEAARTAKKLKTAPKMMARKAVAAGAASKTGKSGKEAVKQAVPGTSATARVVLKPVRPSPHSAPASDKQETGPEAERRPAPPRRRSGAEPEKRDAPLRLRSRGKEPGATGSKSAASPLRVVTHAVPEPSAPSAARKPAAEPSERRGKAPSEQQSTALSPVAGAPGSAALGRKKVVMVASRLKAQPVASPASKQGHKEISAVDGRTRAAEAGSMDSRDRASAGGVVQGEDRGRRDMDARSTAGGGTAPSASGTPDMGAKKHRVKGGGSAAVTSTDTVAKQRPGTKGKGTPRATDMAVSPDESAASEKHELHGKQAQVRRPPSTEGPTTQSTADLPPATAASATERSDSLPTPARNARPAKGSSPSKSERTAAHGVGPRSAAQQARANGGSGDASSGSSVPAIATGGAKETERSAKPVRVRQGFQAYRPQRVGRLLELEAEGAPATSRQGGRNSATDDAATSKPGHATAGARDAPKLPRGEKPASRAQPKSDAPSGMQEPHGRSAQIPSRPAKKHAKPKPKVRPVPGPVMPHPADGGA